MALFHAATITPSKLELVTDWIRTQPWGPPADAPVEMIGAFRFDDPEGQVGMETHLVTAAGTIYQVPTTYRSEPDDASASSLIGTMEHSALGTRWVYDGLGDDRFVLMLAAVTLTGQGEALGMVEFEGRWRIAPAAVRISGGGWTHERAAVDGFSSDRLDDDVVELHNDRFTLTVHRRPTVSESNATMSLTATWEGQADPVTLASMSER